MENNNLKNFITKTTVAELIYTNYLSSYITKIGDNIVDVCELFDIESRLVTLEEREDTFFPVEPQEVYEILNKTVDINFLSLKLHDSIEYLNRKRIKEGTLTSLEQFVLDTVNMYRLHYRIYDDLNDSIIDNIKKLSNTITEDNKESNKKARNYFKWSVLLSILSIGLSIISFIK